MYQIERTVSICETSPHGLLRPGAALDFLLACECFQIDSEDEFSVFLRAHGIAVFLAFRQIEFLRLPSYGERLTIQTGVYDCKSIFGFRNTMMYDASGRVCVGSYAIGAFVDVQTGRPAKIPSEIIRDIHFDPPCPMEYLPRKIALPGTAPEPLAPFTVKRCQADMNGHFNSSRYLDEAMEYLPEDAAFNRIRLEYKAQAKPGEVIRPALYTAPDSSTRLIAMDGANGLCALVEFSDSAAVKAAR